MAARQAFVASSMWTFSLTHSSQYAGAHETFAPFLNLPLLLLFWRRAEVSRSYAVGTGLVLAWMIYDGATYPVPFCVLVLGLETLTRVSKKRLRVLLEATAIVGITSYCRIEIATKPRPSATASRGRESCGPRTALTATARAIIWMANAGTSVM